MEFAKALTNIQEFNLSAPGLAAGLSGKGRGRLVSRIRRITGKPRLQSGYAEGFIAAFILVISLIGLSAAAMITYPVEKELPGDDLAFQEPGNPTSFIQEASTLNIVPDSNDQVEETISSEVNAVEVPDTNDYKHSTSYSEARQKQYNLFLADSIELPEDVLLEIIEMEEELAQIEAQMKALSKETEYLEALEEYQFYIEQSRNALARAKEMEAYKEAMKDLQDQWIISRLSSGEIVPCTHALPDGNFFMIDSATWSFRMPEEFIFHTDSLSDFYIDSWRDQFVEMEEFQLQFEAQNILLAEELEELEELQGLVELQDLAEIEHLSSLNDLSALEGLAGLSDAFGEMSQSIDIIQQELYADALIDKDRDYIFLINEKQMFINGEKQSRANFKKYRRLVDSLDGLSGIEDEDGLKIQIKH